MAHKHSVYDTDLHFIIDPITRKITTECKKTQLMQKDHNSERFTFEIPRYIEGHDMSLCNVVQIHYINTNSTNKDYQVQDIYEVNDLQVSPDSEDIVIGSWLISSNATTYSGTLNFVIRFACVDEETKAIDYQWFTDIYSAITVAKTIYNVDVVTGGESSDLLEKWKEEISKVAGESTLEIVQEAKKSAGDAAKSETNAGEFAKNAASSAESSKKSAETATSQASLASESRIAAESSASSASKSAVESGKSAEEASVSAANAKESEENAKKSEQASSNSASAAAQSETKAKASATDATSSAQSASDDARAAIEYSNSAQQSADTASEKAAEASESAQSASSSATSAVDSATAASASAILAESYTHGRTGTREEEDTDNAKYYMEQAKAVSRVNVATTEKAGIVKPDGKTIQVDSDGTIHGANIYELPVATKDTLGGVKPDGTTITADSDGTIHGANTYELPVATTDTLGGVKPDGTTITADGDGIIRVNADSELSATSTNPVQNKVVKKYVDDRTAVDSAMSDTSTNPVQNKVVKSYVDGRTSSVAWNSITDKPSTYSPSSHTHTKSQITDFPSSLPANGGNSATANSVIDYNNDNDKIKIGYYGDGLRADQIRHMAGFTGDGISDIRIKDVPKGELKSWLGDATTSDHGLMTPAMVSKLNGIAETVNTLKKSVSDGKTLVATAITEKGVNTAADATFAVMAKNIGQIETGSGELHGATISVTTSDENPTTITVTLTKDSTAIEQKNFDSNGMCTFTDIQESGDYTVAVSDGAHSISTTATVTGDNIVNKTVISVTINFTLDGSTATPLNDVSIWLKTDSTGSSKNAGHTTLAQVIADPDTLNNLMRDQSAMQYLARSTGFADEGCASETFMTYLGASTYVDSTVLSSDIWVEKICNSQYMDKVLNDLVPAMTSNTSSVGTAYVSPNSNTYPQYRMFDKNLDTYSGPPAYTDYPHYYGMNFNTNKMIYAISLPIPVSDHYKHPYPPKDCILQISDNGSDWKDIKQFILDNTGGSNNLIVFSPVFTKYIRIKANNGYYTDYDWSGIFEWYIYGR